MGAILIVLQTLEFNSYSIYCSVEMYANSSLIVSCFFHKSCFHLLLWLCIVFIIAVSSNVWLLWYGPGYFLFLPTFYACCCSLKQVFFLDFFEKYSCPFEVFPFFTPKIDMYFIVCEVEIKTNDWKYLLYIKKR